jgi:hypothetical protein
MTRDMDDDIRYYGMRTRNGLVGLARLSEHRTDTIPLLMIRYRNTISKPPYPTPTSSTTAKTGHLPLPLLEPLPNLPPNLSQPTSSLHPMPMDKPTITNPSYLPIE